jgi:hypothetical protein
MIKYIPGDTVQRHALYQTDPDDYYTIIEECFYRWSEMDFNLPDKKGEISAYLKSFFRCADEFFTASLLLIDDQLPEAAAKAYAYSVMYGRDELQGRITSTYLSLEKQKVGRKKNEIDHFRIQSVIKLLLDGEPLSDAYSIAAEEYHVSTDTIRRQFERWKKDIKKYKNTYSKYREKLPQIFP